MSFGNCLSFCVTQNLIYLIYKNKTIKQPLRVTVWLRRYRKIFIKKAFDPKRILQYLIHYYDNKLYASNLCQINKYLLEILLKPYLKWTMHQQFYYVLVNRKFRGKIQIKLAIKCRRPIGYRRLLSQMTLCYNIGVIAPRRAWPPPPGARTDPKANYSLYALYTNWF